MKEGPFPFLRATFYRWAQTWPEVSPETFAAPVALAVGDLHVENFGTWRDVEGRLIWGVNDFDEVWLAAVHLRPGAPGHQRTAGAGRESLARSREGARARRSFRDTKTACAPAAKTSCWPSITPPPPNGGGAVEAAGALLGEAQRAALDPRGAAGERHKSAAADDAGTWFEISRGASPGRAGELGTAALRRAGAVARRQHRARSQGTGRFRRGCSRIRAASPGSCIRKRSIAPCAVPIRSSSCAGAGWCAVSRRIVRGSSSRRCPPARSCRLLHAMGFETANVHWAAARAGVMSARLEGAAERIGFSAPPPPWSLRSARIGRGGRKGRVRATRHPKLARAARKRYHCSSTSIFVGQTSSWTNQQ